MKWSTAQRRAIETQHKNLLVAAAAGSGKTAVLVERIINQLVTGVLDIDRLLVVTFTNAAAAEMRQRIESALRERIIAEPQNEWLARQLVLITGASISTLHSFCQTVIRQYFAAIKIDPDFRLAGEQELRLLRRDAMEDVLADEYERADEKFLAFADAYGSDRGDEPIYGLVLELYDYAMAKPFPLKWLATQGAKFALPPTTELAETPWFSAAMDDIRLSLESAVEANEQLIKTAGEEADFYLPTLEKDRQLLTELSESLADSWEAARQAFNGVKFATLRAPKGTEENLREKFKTAREFIKDTVKNLGDKYFAESEDELLADIRLAAPDMEELCRLTAAFARRFTAAKREKCLADFSDLEHLALAILCKEAAVELDRLSAEDGDCDDAPMGEELTPTEVALALREKYQQVMVDEYQDTNGVQEAILSLVARHDEPNLFAVGDVKQSIYRFRLADPSLFMEKYETYPRKGEGYERIDLSQNFRSRAGILWGINFIFGQLMNKSTMEINYDKDAALYPGLTYPAGDNTLDGAVELDIITTEGEDAEEEDEAVALQGFELEAQHIASRIRAMMAEGVMVFDKKAADYRPLEYRDIVVLLRSLEGKANLLLSALKENDIPAYAAVDAGYFAEPEIETMLALLKVLDNSRQDIPLAAVLLSPIGGFSRSEAALVRLSSAEGDLFTALNSAAAEDTPLGAKAAAFLAKISAWRDYARERRVPELIAKLYRDTGYYDYAGGMPGGLLRQANLRMLISRAAEYETTSFRGLFRFLRFIERLRAMNTDLAAARTLGESEDVVRIMSVHKSKGLEFPVVILADTGKKFNLRDATGTVLLHPELGLGPYAHLRDASLRYPTFPRQAIAARLIQENKAEELRVLYVALTRAREKLIITGCVKAKRLVASAARYQQMATGDKLLLSPAAPLAATSYLDWLALALMRHEAGDVFRKLTGSLMDTLPAKSQYQVQLIPAGDVSIDGEKTSEENPLLAAVAKLAPLPATENAPRMERLLSWQYDQRGLEDVPAKLSVTELKRRFADEEDPSPAKSLMTTEEGWREPAFLSESRPLTGASYGTLLHNVLQHIDLRGDLTFRGLAKQLEGLVAREIILPAEGKRVNIKSLTGFFTSPLGRRLQKARRIWRELPFSQMLPANRFYPDAGDEERLSIQGIIDLLFEEADGRFILVDYKTDGGEKEKIAARYRLQISLYSEAITAITGQPIAERYLYLLTSGQTVAMD